LKPFTRNKLENF